MNIYEPLLFLSLSNPSPSKSTVKSLKVNWHFFSTSLQSETSFWCLACPLPRRVPHDFPHAMLVFVTCHLTVNVSMSRNVVFLPIANLLSFRPTMLMKTFKNVIVLSLRIFEPGRVCCPEEAAMKSLQIEWKAKLLCILYRCHQIRPASGRDDLM